MTDLVGINLATQNSADSRLQDAYESCRQLLLNERVEQGHWEGELSTSALSTATAVMALIQVQRAECDGVDLKVLSGLISGGIRWLLSERNNDGGWGDTPKSLSNISTTMLVRAVLEITKNTDSLKSMIDESYLRHTDDYIERIGGVAAVRERYGKDRTFSVPILMQAALGGLVDWRDVNQLPFEMACLPANWYKWANLPVVSYALPALIAIGVLKHRKRPTWFLPWRVVRNFSEASALKVLRKIQPTTGGFLEATPLTSFVTMSLVAAGHHESPVVKEAVRFLQDSVRPDGSWPIDTNLATWTTTLSLNALNEDLPGEAVEPIVSWLLDQQYQEVHPYTNADPGGWAWTDLSGGVPDADDTPGAILVLSQLKSRVDSTTQKRIDSAICSANIWLLSLQNRDGGWPTFCRGWGKLPFDRSSPDITAHVLRALMETQPESKRQIARGFRFLDRQQRPDGAWLPLWFGNQFAKEDENPVYGTSRVLLAYAVEHEETNSTERKTRMRKGCEFLSSIQNENGGWGGAKDVVSSVEETALAVDALIACKSDPEAIQRGLNWLIHQVEEGKISEASPIGFYFAKLWYYEKLYPLSFATSALRNALKLVL